MRLLALFATILSLLWGRSAIADRTALPPRYQGTAAEECLRDLDRFDGTLRESGFGVLAPGNYDSLAPHAYFVPDRTPRQQIRALRKAAYDLAIRGNEAQCQALLGTMRDLYRQHQQAIGGDAAGQKIHTQWRRAHLAGARRLATVAQPIPASVVIGADVRNMQDQFLGKIVDVVFDAVETKATVVLVARGGSVIYGRDVVGVRWNDLRITEDHRTFVLDVPMTSFKAAPVIKDVTGDQIVRGPWREAFDRFWDKALKKE